MMTPAEHRIRATVIACIAFTAGLLTACLIA